MAPAKIQAFILNQIIISVTYTQYCMAVGGPSVHNVVLHKHTKTNSENVTTMASQWQNKPTKSINSRRATHSSTASAPGTKKPEIIYTGSEETHVRHECFGYLSLRSDLITIT